jgi:peptidoglycan/xylan/chitin deacetylase (PgdA/CDA1 family)
MDPQSQLYGATLVRRRDAAGKKLLALTYDDGPNDPHTGHLLEVLTRENVRATFFMIGRYAAAHAHIARLVASAGHEIGNHTASHPNLIFRTALATQQQLESCERSLTDAVGPHSRYFRPPFGGRRPSTLRAVQRLGLTTVMWSVSGRDWKLGTRGIEQHVAEHIRGGDIILLHDGSDRAFGADRSATVAATAALIPKLRDEGYRFVSVGEMFGETVGGRPSALG